MSFTPNDPSSTTSSSSDPAAPETAFLSLPNGCLCCSIKEPGIAAIENMIVEQERLGQGEGKGKGRGVDRVVVELTGVADPGKLDDIPLDNPFSLPENCVLTGLTTLFLMSTFSVLGLLCHSSIRVAEIARSFWTNEEMGGSLRLDGVVCVVDSRNVLKVRASLQLCYSHEVLMG